MKEYENNLKEIIEKFNRTLELLTYEEVLENKKLFLHLDQQRISMQPIILKHEEYIKLNNEINSLSSIIDEVDGKDRELFNEELQSVRDKFDLVTSQLKALIIKHCGENQEIILEIIASKQTLSNYLLELLREGYSNFCKNVGFDCQCTNENNTSKLHIIGTNVRALLEKESGLHSIKKSHEEGVCQVFVYNQILQNISFDDKYIQITACRSSGAGGQHINTTDSAIKIVHLPTGISTICQDERNQIQNRIKGLENLKEKVVNFYKSQRNKSIELEKQEQIKRMKNKQIIKNFLVDENIIIKHNKETISLSDFVQGKVL